MVLEVMYKNMIWYFEDFVVLINFLKNWDLNFYFLKIRSVKIFILYIVLIIWNKLIELFVLKEVRINDIKNGNESMILYIMVVCVEVCFFSILVEFNFLFDVDVGLNIFWVLFMKCIGIDLLLKVFIYILIIKMMDSKLNLIIIGLI